jgi:hypothetical protein
MTLSLVTDDNTKNDIINLLLLNLGVKHQEIIDETHANDIKNNVHSVCIQSVGIPYLMYIINHNSEQICYMINKDTYVLYTIDLKFKNNVYNETLLDVEYIMSDNLMIINDIYKFCGEDLSKKYLLMRMNMSKKLFNLYNREKNGLLFDTKYYFQYKHLEHIYKSYRKKLKYNTNGLLFKRNNITHTVYYYIFKKNEFKITEDHGDESKFFIIKKDNTLPDIYELYCQNMSSKLYKHSYASIPSLKCSMYMRNMFIKQNENDNENDDNELIFECKYITEFNKWYPVDRANKEVSII